MANEDEFTLEKLKVTERLHSVELQLARLSSHLESERGTFARIQANVDDMFGRVMKIVEMHEKIFFGDRDPGIMTKIDRLEQVEEKRTWHLRLIWASILGIMVKAVHDYFSTKPGP